VLLIEKYFKVQRSCPNDIVQVGVNGVRRSNKKSSNLF